MQTLLKLRRSGWKYIVQIVPPLLSRGYHRCITNMFRRTRVFHVILRTIWSQDQHKKIRRTQKHQHEPAVITQSVPFGCHSYCIWLNDITAWKLMSEYHMVFWQGTKEGKAERSGLSFQFPCSHSTCEVSFDRRGIKEFRTDSKREALFGCSLGTTGMGEPCSPQRPEHFQPGFFNESAESRSSKSSSPSLYLWHWNSFAWP